MLKKTPLDFAERSGLASKAVLWLLENAENASIRDPANIVAALDALGMIKHPGAVPNTMAMVAHARRWLNSFIIAEWRERLEAFIAEWPEKGTDHGPDDEATDYLAARSAQQGSPEAAQPGQEDAAGTAGGQT
jgi:hypothetical protein